MCVRAQLVTAALQGWFSAWACVSKVNKVDIHFAIGFFGLDDRPVESFLVVRSDHDRLRGQLVKFFLRECRRSGLFFFDELFDDFSGFQVFLDVKSLFTGLDMNWSAWNTLEKWFRLQSEKQVYVQESRSMCISDFSAFAPSRIFFSSSDSRTNWFSASLPTIFPWKRSPAIFWAMLSIFTSGTTMRAEKSEVICWCSSLRTCCVRECATIRVRCCRTMGFGQLSSGRSIHVSCIAEVNETNFGLIIILRKNHC